VILKSIHCFPIPTQFATYLTEQRIWNQVTFSREQVTSYLMATCGTETLLLIEWPDQAAVDRFMAGTHEELMQQHNLTPYLDTYHVRYMDLVGDLRRAPAWEEVVPGQTVIRQTKCQVPPEALAEFLAVQGEVWSPGMSRAPGFLGGRIWRRRGAPADLLLVGLFQDQAAHAAYQNHVKELQGAGAQSLACCTAIESREFLVQEIWHRENQGAGLTRFGE
jgi:quinol monooxygenase YgiN